METRTWSIRLQRQQAGDGEALWTATLTEEGSDGIVAVEEDPTCVGALCALGSALPE